MNLPVRLIVDLTELFTKTELIDYDGEIRSEVFAQAYYTLQQPAYNLSNLYAPHPLTPTFDRTPLAQQGVLPEILDLLDDTFYLLYHQLGGQLAALGGFELHNCHSGFFPFIIETLRYPNTVVFKRMSVEEYLHVVSAQTYRGPAPLHRWVDVPET